MLIIFQNLQFILTQLLPNTEFKLIYLQVLFATVAANSHRSSCPIRFEKIHIFPWAFRLFNCLECFSEM